MQTDDVPSEPPLLVTTDEWIRDFGVMCLAGIAALLPTADTTELVSAPYSLLLFGLMVWSGFSIVRHCRPIGSHLGEPYGTLVGTFASNSIEVASIAAIILHRSNNPTLLRDTLLSTIMIVMNCVLGTALLSGGWGRRELSYNLQGANNYLSVLLPLSVLTLILPGIVDSTSGAVLDFRQTAFLMLMCVSLYAAFITMQAGRHRSYFVEATSAPQHAVQARRLTLHLILLGGNVAVAALLAIKLAGPVDYILEDLRLNPVLGGIIIALLGGLPEAVEAVQAAREDRLQHAVNVLLGSALATISITVPAVLIIAHLTGRSVQLAAQGTDLLMLGLTLAVTIVTFASGRTTMLQGFVHLLLFGAYLLLIAGS